MVDSSEQFPSDAAVARALDVRTGGTTDAEVRRIGRALLRLRPAADAAAGADGGSVRPDDFERTLQSLADV